MKQARTSVAAAAIATLSLLAACGGDDDGGGMGGPDADLADAAVTSCGMFETTTSINSYPASYEGDTSGAGADMGVTEGTCDDERSFFEQVGEDQVILLSNLTPGADYAVRVDAAADVSFYVATGCGAAGPEAGQCLLFVDEGIAREFGDFTAPDSGVAFLIIDRFGEEAPEDGTYTVDVFEAECSGDDECTGEDAGVCYERTCVECSTNVHCTDTETPICDVESNACVGGFSECVDDDPSPPEDGDDGPAGATPIEVTAETPGTGSGSVCSAPAAEADHFSFEVTETGRRSVALDWEGEDDLDLIVIDSMGGLVGFSLSGQPEVVNEELEPGTYYAIVTKYTEQPDTAVTPYDVTIRIPECASSFDCESPAAPFCNPVGVCEAGPDLCEGDDTAAEDGGDDGPAGATILAPAVGGQDQVTSQICSSPSTEADFFQITVDDGADVTLEVDWTDEVADLDVFVWGEAGTQYGATFWVQPEVIDLTNLPAGTYYAEVLYFGAETTTSVDYTITASLAAGGCETAADCAAEFSTQVFRGECTSGTGACSFIEGEGALDEGAACDSADDCSNGTCSYLLFQENAHLSVCTSTCTDSSECDSGFSCTVPFATNFCNPDCSGNLECGANPGSDELDVDQPWDYLTCNAGACEL